jgi:hypothetical protein
MNGSGEDIMLWTASLGITTGFYCIISGTLILKQRWKLSYTQKRVLWHLGNERTSPDPFSSSPNEIMLDLLLIQTNLFTVWCLWWRLLCVIIGHIFLVYIDFWIHLCVHVVPIWRLGYEREGNRLKWSLRGKEKKRENEAFEVVYDLMNCWTDAHGALLIIIYRKINVWTDPYLSKIPRQSRQSAFHETIYQAPTYQPH